MTRLSVVFAISAGAAATAVGLAVFVDLLERKQESLLARGQLGRRRGS